MNNNKLDTSFNVAQQNRLHPEVIIRAMDYFLELQAHKIIEEV